MVDAKPVLYVVNTTISPLFFNDTFACALPISADKKHKEFIRKVREQHPKFDLPYVALLSDEKLEIPFPGPIRGGLVDRVRDDMIEGKPLDQWVEQYIEGRDTIMRGHTIPITGVVEFSPTELYPAPMKRLGARYELRRITVN